MRQILIDGFNDLHEECGTTATFGASTVNCLTDEETIFEDLELGGISEEIDGAIQLLKDDFTVLPDAGDRFTFNSNQYRVARVQAEFADPIVTVAYKLLQAITTNNKQGAASITLAATATATHEEAPPTNATGSASITIAATATSTTWSVYSSTALAAISVSASATAGMQSATSASGSASITLSATGAATTTSTTSATAAASISIGASGSATMISTTSASASASITLSASASPTVASYLYESDVLSLSDNLLWLRADDIDGDESRADNPTDGTAVASWASRANGLTISQSTSSAQPTLETNENGSLPAVKFDGTNYMHVDWTSDTSNFTVFLVVKQFNSSSYGGYFFDGGYASSSRLGWLDRASGNFRMGGVANFTDTLAESGKSNDTDWHLVTAHFDGSSSSLRVDLSAVGSGDIGSTNGTYSASEGITLGSEGSGNYASQILVGEMLVFNGSLSSADRDKVEGYLGDKWSISATISASGSAAIAVSASATATSEAGAFSISTFNTESNILATTPAEGTVAFGTDTQSYYVKTDHGWAEFKP